MKDFLKIASTRTNLLKKTTKFEWIKKCEMAFQELMQRLTTASILTLSVEGKEYTLYSDASKNGLDCVLMQEDKLVAYAFRQFKPYEKNYPTYNLELTIVVFALKIWRHNLYRVLCKIFTNHQSLNTFLLRKSSQLKTKAVTEIIERL